jgi:prostaglandin-E synthase 1
MCRMPLERRILVRMWRIGYIVAMPMSAPPAFTAYAVCSVVLSLEMLFLGGYTAATRARHKGYMNPEDDKVSFKDARLVEGAEHPDVARVQRAHRNLMESLPMFFAIGLIAVLIGASPLGVEVCCGVFTAARVLHAIVYIRGLQPWRTILYGVGTLALVALMALSMYTLFTR